MCVYEQEIYIYHASTLVKYLDKTIQLFVKLVLINDSVEASLESSVKGHGQDRRLGVQTEEVFSFFCFLLLLDFLAINRGAGTRQTSKRAV